jgi:hypothetical protein
MVRAIERRLAGRSGREIAALVLKNLAHAAGQLGPAAAIRRHRAGAFDRRWGTETSRLANLSALAVDPSRARHGVRYQPSSGEVLAHAVRAFGLRPEEFAFVDYGSGKGRVCMVAAQAGFGRVVGVEFSPELCEVARSNVARFVAAGGASRAPEIVLGDAGAYAPPSGPLLAYLYNPFGPPVLDEVVARLAAKGIAGDPVFVCYVDPRHLAAFDGWEMVERTDEFALLRHAGMRG